MEDLVIKVMNYMTLEELSKLILQQAKEKGFGTMPHEINIPEKIALIHSEISEAYQAYRHKNMKGKDGFEEELGDALQRILHLCAVLKIDIQKVILKKIKYNKKRVWNWGELNDAHA